MTAYSLLLHNHNHPHRQHRTATPGQRSEGSEGSAVSVLLSAFSALTLSVVRKQFSYKSIFTHSMAGCQSLCRLFLYFALLVQLIKSSFHVTNSEFAGIQETKRKQPAAFLLLYSVSICVISFQAVRYRPDLFDRSGSGSCAANTG